MLLDKDAICIWVEFSDWAKEGEIWPTFHIQRVYLVVKWVKIGFMLITYISHWSKSMNMILALNSRVTNSVSIVVNVICSNPKLRYSK